MQKKNLIIFLSVLLGIILAAVLVSAIIMLPGNSDNPSSEETPAVSDASGIIDRFSCITVTAGGDPATSVNITWCSLGEAYSGVVSYCKASSGDFESTAKLTAAALPEATDFSVPVAGQFDYKVPTLEEAAGYTYRTYLTGLDSGTEYYYRVEDSLGNFSSVGTFTTADTGSDFSFLLVSDTQGFTARNFEIWGNLSEIAADMFPSYDFIIHMGDAVEDGKNLYQWQMFFNSAESIVRSSTIIDVAGNQDKKYTLLHYTNGSEDNRTALVSGYYSFDWGNVHFSVLNTGDGDKDLAKSQIKWLKKDLEAAADKTKIILIHKAPYSNANHYNDEEILAIREQIMPVATEYNVSLVLQGHDHYYFRSEPMEGSEEVAAYECSDLTVDGEAVKMFATEGTVYLINGSAGCKQHSGTVYEDSGIAAAEAAILEGPSFSYVTVDEEKIIFRTYYINNGVAKALDHWGIYLK